MKQKTDDQVETVDAEELEDVEAEEVDIESSLLDKIDAIQAEVTQARENELRAIADYKNLMRRTQEDRLKMITLAGRSVIEKFLQPLEHLYLAKEQLKDQGLNMVYQQFQQALQAEGLEEIQVMGKEFDPQLMEVVDKEKATDPKQVDRVIKVTQRGYMLNGEVIQHAKVVIGTDK